MSLHDLSSGGRLSAHRHPISLTPTALRRWLGLGVLLIGSFVTSLDSFIVFVAVPSIRTTLGATFGETELIVAGYALTAAVGLIVSGRLGDRFGRRRMFIIGFGAFTLASGLCGIAQSPVALIISRLIQGCAASVLIPQVFALIRVTFTDPKERATAFGWMGVTIGAGAIAGQIVGGFIIAADIWHLAWRPIFLINLPVGVCALIGASLLVKESESDARERLDLVGAVLSALGLGLLLYPLIEGREAGWPIWSMSMMGAGVVVLSVFGLHQRWKTRHGAFPLLNTDLFHDQAFTVGLFLILLFFGTIGPLMLSFSYLAQIGFSRSPVTAALDFSPLAVSFTIASLLAGKYSHFGARKILATGAVVVTVGALAAYLVCLVLASPTPEALILPLIVLGIGQGMFMTPVLNVVLSAIPENHSGAASGVLTTVQRAGYALGVAALEVPFFTTLDGAKIAGSSQSAAYLAAFAAVAVCILVTMIVVLVLLALLPSGTGARALSR
jgi:EmrB/QacA subfamily drug resistance transporter